MDTTILVTPAAVPIPAAEALSLFPSLISPASVLVAVAGTRVSLFGLTPEGIELIARELVARDNVARLSASRRSPRRLRARTVVAPVGAVVAR